jgi:hypothetical protein
VKIPPLPNCPKPTHRDEAFRAGVRGAPFAKIDDLPIVPIVVTHAPGPDIAAVERLNSWPPAQKLTDLQEVYKIGRCLRAIALKLDRWREAESVFMKTAQILLDHGALHLRLNRAYGLSVLLDDYEKVLQSLPNYVRRNESVEGIIAELSQFANKSREWDEHDF